MGVIAAIFYVISFTHSFSGGMSGLAAAVVVKAFPIYFYLCMNHFLGNWLAGAIEGEYTLCGNSSGAG